jgi:peptidyl-Lys metalloendopeptidase
MIASTFVILASALAASATRSLKVEASAPLVVSNIDDFEIKTTVTNTGDEPLKLLKDPRGPLSQWGTNTFETTNQDGAAAEFTGVYVRYVPSKIAKTTQESHFTVLAPGASAEISHEGKCITFHRDHIADTTPQSAVTTTSPLVAQDPGPSVP